MLFFIKKLETTNLQRGGMGMSINLFESMIGNHCSPVLMGLKPSNLVSFSKEKFPELPKYAELYTEQLKEEGIRMELLCSCKKHYLLLVYRPELLEEYLSNEEARKILAQDGYPEAGTLEEMITYLKARYEEKKGVPHEIGIFLGYPLEDVKGFQEFNGDSCKMCGYWKVYGDVEAAKKQFAKFDKCRGFINEQLGAGRSIHQVIGMKELCVA